MQGSAKHRFALTLMATLVGALVGLAAGDALTSYISLRMAEHRLEHSATALHQTGAEIGTEMANTFKLLENSHLPYCSQDELRYFRKVIFQTSYIWDAGHLHGRHFDCSMTLDPLDLPEDLEGSPLLLPSGKEIYPAVGALQIRNQSTYVIVEGDTYVVLNVTANPASGGVTPHAFLTSTQLVDGHYPLLMGTLPDRTKHVFTQNGSYHEGKILYYTLCAPEQKLCYTIFVELSQALAAERMEIRAGSGLGAILGAVLGFLSTVAHRRNRSLAQQLRRAIRRDQLRVVYQPIVTLGTQHIVGAEALLRWTDEDGTPIAPDVFVRIAEEMGFVGEITRLVLRHGLRDLGAVMREHPEFHLSINITASDLSDKEFLPMLERMLAGHNVAPASLILEITESSTARKEDALTTIRALRERGHRVHIDDFGTGYSSLAYLHDLSVDAIKIDRVFTQAIGTEAVTVSILPQILEMARTLQLEVVVEGVENVQQAGYFADSRCKVMAQGWLFGRPVPLEEFQLQLELDRVS